MVLSEEIGTCCLLGKHSRLIFTVPELCSLVKSSWFTRASYTGVLARFFNTSLLRRIRLEELTAVWARLTEIREYLKRSELIKDSNVFAKLWPNCTLPDKSSVSIYEY